MCGVLGLAGTGEVFKGLGVVSPGTYRGGACQV
jgi:hypothetical protein